MKNWITKALGLLSSSLENTKHEHNELDWKIGLSNDKKRLAEHLSAMANFPGGGFLVYGINNVGDLIGVDNSNEIEVIINTLGNLSRESLDPPIALDFSSENYLGVNLLIVYIAESNIKPVQLRGKNIDHTFIRSAGNTRKASRSDIGAMMLNSRNPRWEELRATNLLTEEELLNELSIEPILEMLNRTLSKNQREIVNWVLGEGFVSLEPSGGGYVTNLGAITASKKLSHFSEISRKALRVIVYNGNNEASLKLEQEGSRGYAIGFQGVLKFITGQLPQSEIIHNALRVKQTVYPEIALREIIANALIHQDFSITGAGPMVKIFDDRIEISNPGGILPSKQLNRLIGTQPESRNEKLARAFRRYKICEEQGSGLIKAGIAIELYGLPPIKFESSANSFIVTLHAPRTFAQMSAEERLDACYQHSVLKHLSGKGMTNKSLRERLKMPEKQRTMVSLIIQEALDKRLIKPADPENKSKKFSEYIPNWA
jgi:predicted HTH transcriptional regulator